MKFTGNKEIDKQIKRGLGPLDPVNMDDYWDPHDTFLEHIVEVGSSDDIKLMFEENFGIDKLLRLGEDAKVILASQGYAHELLATDENENVRASVAKHCDNPEQFLDDESYYVKTALISRDIGLDKFANDDSLIQRAVVRRGYNLEQFVNSDKFRVRQEVAKQGYGLEQLSNDPDDRVLEEVARQGYKPEVFANHEDERIRYAACQAGAYPERFAKDPNPKFRAAVARNGDCLDILQHDDSPKVIYGVIKNDYNLEQFVHHPDELARRLTVHQAYMSKDPELKESIYSQMRDDESSIVRATIADDGYYLEHYVTDESESVREAVAKQGYALERLVNDPSEWVQMRVAEHGYGLEQLKDSPSALVRGMVAAQGYQPEVFANDPEEEVAEVARPILAELEWEREHEVTLSTEDLAGLSETSLTL